MFEPTFILARSGSNLWELLFYAAIFVVIPVLNGIVGWLQKRAAEKQKALTGDLAGTAGPRPKAKPSAPPPRTSVGAPSASRQEHAASPGPTMIEVRPGEWKIMVGTHGLEVRNEVPPGAARAVQPPVSTPREKPPAKPVRGSRPGAPKKRTAPSVHKDLERQVNWRRVTSVGQALPPVSAPDVAGLSVEDWRRAVVLVEVLGPPLALREAPRLF